MHYFIDPVFRKTYAATRQTTIGEDTYVEIYQTISPLEEHLDFCAQAIEKNYQELSEAGQALE